MALPEDHLAKFHKMTDAKEIWKAIKSRFGRNDESKKMQKYFLKQQFEGFSVSNSEGLHKGYDRFQSLQSTRAYGAASPMKMQIKNSLRSPTFDWSQVSLIMRIKPGVDSLSFDDLYNNLRVFESDVKGSTASSSSTQNVAFVSENTSSTNDDLEQLDEFDLEEMDLKWQLSKHGLLLERAELQGESDSRRRDTGTLREQLGDASIEIQTYTHALKKVEAQLVAHQQSQLWYKEKIRFMKIDLDDKTDVLTYHKKLLAEAEKEKEDLKAKVEKTSDIEDSPMNDRYAEGMHAVPLPMTGIYIPSGPDKEIDDSQFTYGPKQSKPSESDARSSDF
ncbi:hypothetical protein Tco_0886421 [Tanacetum coccineum]